MTDTPKREPLLSDATIVEIIDSQYDHDFENFKDVGRQVRDHYENLIDTGVLMVVKTAGIDADGNCTECGWDADHRYPFSTCCPGCGLRIVE